MPKADKDFSKDVDKLLPEAQKLAQVRIFGHIPRAKPNMISAVECHGRYREALGAGEAD